MSLPLGKVIKFELPGVPVPKGRPRSTIIRPRNGKPPFISIYTPKETILYERALAQIGRVAMGVRPPLEGPLQVTIVAWMPIPESWSGVKRLKAQNGEIRPSGKPDYDNFAKIVGDALNQIVWEDDSQIVDGQCVKMYSRNPRLTVEVIEL